MCFNYHFCQLHFDIKSNKNAKSSSIWKNFGPKKMKPDERIYTRLMKMLQSSLQVNRAVDVQYTIMTDTKQTTGAHQTQWYYLWVHQSIKCYIGFAIFGF